jgi:hypothetical protein
MNQIPAALFLVIHIDYRRIPLRETGSWIVTVLYDGSDQERTTKMLVRSSTHLSGTLKDPFFHVSFLAYHMQSLRKIGTGYISKGMACRNRSEMPHDEHSVENSTSGGLVASQPSSDSNSPTIEAKAEKKPISQTPAVLPEAHNPRSEVDEGESWTSHLQGWRLQVLNVGSASPHGRDNEPRTNR